MHLAKCLKNIRLANFAFLWHATVLGLQNSHLKRASSSGPCVQAHSGDRRNSGWRGFLWGKMEAGTTGLPPFLPPLFFASRTELDLLSPIALGIFEEGYAFSGACVLCPQRQDLMVHNCPGVQVLSLQPDFLPWMLAVLTYTADDVEPPPPWGRSPVYLVTPVAGDCVSHVLIPGNAVMSLKLFHGRRLWNTPSPPSPVLCCLCHSS